LLKVREEIMEDNNKDLNVMEKSDPNKLQFIAKKKLFFVDIRRRTP